MDKVRERPPQRRTSIVLYVLSLALFAQTIMQTSGEVDCRVGGRSITLNKMRENLTNVPFNYDSRFQKVHLGYNMITHLKDQEFSNMKYKNIRKILMWHNNLQNISAKAFEGLKRLKLLDLSDNQLKELDPNTFQTNVQLCQLLITNNHLRFQRDAVFLFSDSIETLILSNNEITEVYVNTFAGLPNLKRLLLSNNRQLKTLESHCFVKLNHLRYLSLGNTALTKLGEHVFDINKIPELMNLEGTPLSDRFVPPLKHVTKEAIKKLLWVDSLNNINVLCSGTDKD